MLTHSKSQPRFRSLADPEFKKELQTLRETDNYRNWFYLLRTYVLMAAVIGCAVWCHQSARDFGASPLWVVPIFVTAIALVGAFQHHLASLAHEAVHHTLFKNRTLNDMISEWLCSFPMFSSTFHYGLHHLAHHQFVNDPVRDPDISQLQKSGHRLTFPIVRDEFLDVLFRQMWVPNLVRYTMARAEYDSIGTVHNPYLRTDWQFSTIPARIAGAFLGTIAIVLTVLVMYGSADLLAWVPLTIWAAFMATIWMLPERCFYQSKIQPLVSVRILTMMRMTFLAAAFIGVAWATWITEDWWAAYLLVLWVTPLLTTFPFYMVLRQIVQHGNGDRGWLTNTRVFLCHPLVNFAVFPLGQDYHLPHHMFATIPHYRLRKLHELMKDIPEYSDRATVVEGYVWPKKTPQTRPTVVDVLGPDYAPQEFQDVFIDNSVLEGGNISEREKSEILDDATRAASHGGKASPSGSWLATDKPTTSRSEVA